MHWESEFPLASALGVDYIELIAEQNHNPSNPIWSADGVERIKEARGVHARNTSRQESILRTATYGMEFVKYSHAEYFAGWAS